MQGHGWPKRFGRMETFKITSGGVNLPGIWMMN
jgi:hypothetical protein